MIAYVGYWHFHPSILRNDNRGPLSEVDQATATKIGLRKSDIKSTISGNSRYFAAPNYGDWKRDSQSAKAVSDPVAYYLQDEFDDSSEDDDDDDEATIASRHRPPPYVREVQKTQRRVESTDSLSISIEIVNLRNELEMTRNVLSMAKKKNDYLAAQVRTQEKKLMRSLQIEEELAKVRSRGGLSRRNLTCRKWHDKNSHYARHFFGLGENYSHVETYVTEVWFPEVEPVGGTGNANLTEFEEVLVCLMRSHRAYDVKTLGSIWGRTSEGWATRIFRSGCQNLGE